ncbi:hypothetical protein V6Z11_A03G033200 [Gossypium hirsutum]
MSAMENCSPTRDHETQVVSEAGGWCPERWWHTWQRRQRLKVCS